MLLRASWKERVKAAYKAIGVEYQNRLHKCDALGVTPGVLAQRFDFEGLDIHNRLQYKGFQVTDGLSSHGKKRFHGNWRSKRKHFLFQSYTLLDALFQIW
jgi:hypothetical protein